MTNGVTRETAFLREFSARGSQLSWRTTRRLGGRGPVEESGGPRDLAVAARLNGEGLRHLSPRIGDESAVEVDGDAPAPTGVDRDRRGVADVLADDGAVDLAAAAAAPHGEVADRVDDPTHTEATGDVEATRHHDHAAEGAARVSLRVALDVDAGEVLSLGGVGTILVDVLAAHGVDVDDAVGELVAGVEGQALDGGTAEVGAIGLGYRLEAVEIRGL